jgi:hypothetical protein
MNAEIRVTVRIAYAYYVLEDWIDSTDGYPDV